MMFPDFGTKNAPPVRISSWLAMGAALAAVLVLRLWRLAEAGLPDYDSVRNWQVVAELAQGDFTHLFHHGSPGFLLSYVPVAWLTPDYRTFQLLNAGLAVVGLGLFAGWVRQVAGLSAGQTAGLLLLAGTSTLLTLSGRDFSMSSGSLVLMAGLWRSHFRRLHEPRPANVLAVAGWLAAGLCFNYKFLFALPILAVFELWQRGGLLWRRGTWWRVLLVLGTPYVLLSAVGAVAGLPWYRWLGFYVRTILPTAANAAGRQGTLHLDSSYYLRYLLTYESPLLVLGLALAVVLALRGKKPAAGQPPTIPVYLLVWAGCLLAGMSLLVKAPRGLLFAYLPLAALAVLSARRLLPSWALSVGLVLALGWNARLLHWEIYALLPTHYPQVAAWLRLRHATRIVSTVGQGLAPHLAASQRLAVITDERQLAGLRRQGYQYVLLDNYYRVAGIARFDSLRRQPPLAAWAEPPLLAPLLFLEHSEFTGLGFAETIAACREAGRDSFQLRIYRL